MIKVIKVFPPLLLALVLLLQSCNSYQKLLKSDDINLKYEKAEEYFKEGDYKRALPLLEDLSTYFRGLPKGENIMYWLAYTYYQMGQFRLAAFSFKTFNATYPLSQYNEEAAFLSAFNLYQASPRKDLDQKSTIEAINEFLLFTKKYPESSKIEEANNYIDELYAKLEAKAVENALLYYKVRDYRAAVWAIKDVLEQYPATNQRERLEFFLVKSAYLLAQNSVEEKKEERFSSALQYYYEFIDKYPSSTYSDEARNIEKNIQSELKS